MRAALTRAAEWDFEAASVYERDFLVRGFTLLLERRAARSQPPHAGDGEPWQYVTRR